MKSKVLILIIISAGLLFITPACELNDWDAVFNAPSAPTNCSVTGIGEAGESLQLIRFTVAFTVPAQREWEVFPNHDIDVFFSYRKSGTDAETASIVNVLGVSVYSDAADEAQSAEFDILKSELENGAEYIITFQAADGDYQVSDPVDADAVPVSW